MASMRDIKRRKSSIQSTQQITKAMKLVSTVPDRIFHVETFWKYHASVFKSRHIGEKSCDRDHI